MSVAENKKLIRGYFGVNAETIKSKKPGAKDEFHSAGVIIHTTMGDMGLKQFDEMMVGEIAAIPDYKYTISDLIAEGNKVVARYQFTGTHKGKIMNIPASGKKISIEGIGIFRIARGKIAEAWYASDALGLMTQIGALPAAKAPK